jgi:hypothetical protein
MSSYPNNRSAGPRPASSGETETKKEKIIVSKNLKIGLNPELLS